MMMGWAARCLVAGVILLVAGVVTLGCAGDEPGGMASLPVATDLPAATDLPVATSLPAATDLPTYAVSSTATPPPPATSTADTDLNSGFIPVWVPRLVQIRLVERLDARPDFYCIDVPGFGDDIRLDAPLQVHTCKWEAADQMFFEIAGINYIALVMKPDYCLAPSAISAGATLSLTECSYASDQLFWFRTGRTNAGQIYLYSESGPSELCLGAAAGPGEPAGGRNHLRRDLTVYDCDAADPSLVTWIFREEGARMN